MIRFRILLLLGLAAGSAGPALAAPKVVATIQPVHSLIAGVMAGIGQPDLLIQATASEHSYALRPSDARLLDGADVVFWIGEDLERQLRKPLAALAGKARIVTLAEEAGLRLLPLRRGGGWEAHGEDHEDGGSGPGHAHAQGAENRAEGAQDLTAPDPHVWLDPENAKRIASKAAEVLAALDPDNGRRYAANARRTAEALDGLDGELRAALAPVRGRPYLVFHDAYQYFENRYDLAAVGSVTVSAERQPGPRRLYEVRARLLETGAQCIFGEPQHDMRLARTIAESTPARLGQLDPVGAAIAPGPEAYFTLMRQLAGSLVGCLADGS